MLTQLTTATLFAALLVTPVFAQSSSTADQTRMQKQGMQTNQAQAADKSKSDKKQASHAGDQSKARNDHAGKSATAHDGMNRQGMDHQGMGHGMMKQGGMAQNDHKMMQGQMNAAQVQKMTEGWPEPSRKAIQAMSEKYGPPAAVTADMVLWNEAGPWKRTAVYREAVPHQFPMPHMDVLQQWTDYKAPPSKYDELAMFDGSVVLARTAGEISARCDKEPANILALNLADEVASGKRSVEEARKMYGEQIKALMEGKPAPYTEKLMFTTAGDTQAPDKALAGM
ncbi:hypothetical protein ACFFGH_04725 [Lysobacter korlensis]|uniref:Uncharacterized protein n=1 Tax=Lysobacter korlensis TaxID=553636 RepID=A0ABV6RJJ7_9GAMM